MTEALAIVLTETGGPDLLRLQPVALAAPEPGQVLVRHEAIGLNFIDTYFRSGLYPAKLPTGIGGEAAGTVIAVGADVGDLAEGDRVGYFTGPPGSYATHRVVDRDRLVKLPDGISAEIAAASMLKGCTAEYLIERCARVEAGQWVLVHAAAGGVGTILVQWLKAIGARVIAHAGTPEKAAMATAHGADHALSCPFDALAGEVRALTGGDGVPVVLDGVGKDSWAASLGSLARRGMLVTYGNASGAVPPFSPMELVRAGSVYVTRPSLADYCASAAEVQASAARLFAMIESGKVEIKIGRRFALADAAEAHRALEARETTGSTLLVP